MKLLFICFLELNLKISVYITFSLLDIELTIKNNAIPIYYEKLTMIKKSFSTRTYVTLHKINRIILGNQQTPWQTLGKHVFMFHQNITYHDEKT